MMLALRSDVVRSFYRKMADAGERRRRGRFAIAATETPGPRPTIYFLTPDYQIPSGGVRVIYRHVDILNAAGMRAFVLHYRPGFRCAWFENGTKVTDLPSTVLHGGDLLVVPEVDVDLLARLRPGIRHVIFNQNSHFTWRRSADVARFYAPRPDLAGVVAVSRHNQQMLRDAFPGCEVGRVRLGIDPDLFRAGDLPRPRRISYMLRRDRGDAWQVLQMLRGKGMFEGWEVAPLAGLSQAELARQLRETSIFLSFTYQEGFGLPAAEAMACGCYVIGNHGFAGREFFRPEFSAPIEAGDVPGFVRAVETALTNEGHQPGWCAERGRQASGFIRSRYSLAQEREDVTATYAAFLDVRAQRQVAGA
ncbi:glycosyltransferase [Mesorhizobium sp. SP-1A]|uniref:glycosyltransferase n=1 Tax=Mesorhizobium sp. SP-1A TaxID=3077840 RepID=UPI0028F6D951|nr:glycosyltransferase [Mesorhizobium sp. SP-1A]